MNRVVELKPSKYIELGDLKRMESQLRDLDVFDLADTLKDWIETEKKGEYLMNILTTSEINKLNKWLR
ncbi:hypothetical protein [Methanobrevibacter sp. DSM 116169]|uniref:hypothetical protein n=1 Tax=Methanobrevibacter sp. DSM 116169 TaxID=3242727 RepID=UPI0038FC31D0